MNADCLDSLDSMGVQLCKKESNHGNYLEVCIEMRIYVGLWVVTLRKFSMKKRRGGVPRAQGEINSFREAINFCGLNSLQCTRYPYIRSMAGKRQQLTVQIG